MAAVRGNGRRRHDQQVGVATATVVTPPLVPQGGPLLHTETVLLVDDHDTEGRNPTWSVSRAWVPDQQVDGPVRQPGVELVRSPAGGPVGQEGRPQGAPSLERGVDRAPTARRGACGPRRRAVRPGPRSGAMSAPWCPPSTATSMAATATTVFPEPTSP